MFTLYGQRGSEREATGCWFVSPVPQFVLCGGFLDMAGLKENSGQHV